MTTQHPPTDGGALAALRAATRAQHNSLDGTSTLARLMQDDLSTEELIELLQRLHTVHVAFEAARSEARRHWDCPPGALRSRLLREDLAALGGAAAGGRLDGVVEVDVPRGPAELAGLEYVLEGSCLGGLLIRKRLLQRFGPSAEGFTRFFGGHGADTQRHWRDTCDRVEQALGSPVEREAACRSARRAFAVFDAVFSKPLRAAPTTPHLTPLAG